MDGSEWQTCTDPKHMIEFVQDKVSDRKLRLFAVEMCESVWRHYDHPEKAAVLELLSSYAEGKAVQQDVKQACEVYDDSAFFRLQAVKYLLYQATLFTDDGWTNAKLANHYQMVLYPDPERAVARLHELIGPLLFRAVAIPPAILRWNDGTAVAIAKAIYDERAFDRLPILADALEDAGCTDADILNHCRLPGEHVRGCWVLDLLLGQI